MCLGDRVGLRVPFPFICACMPGFPKVTFPIILGDHKTSSHKSVYLFQSINKARSAGQSSSCSLEYITVTKVK